MIIMKNQDKIIKKLIKIAIKHYDNGLHADLYATTATYAFARAAAAEFSAESAGAVAFVAGSENADSIVDFTNHLAKLDDSKTTIRNDMISHHFKMNTHTDEIPAPLLTVQFFEKIAEMQGRAPLGHHASELYHSTFDTSQSEDHRLALIAACTNYAHVHSSARSAYVHAIKVAAPYPAGDSRRAVFTNAFTTRLSSDLSHNPINPGFFMAIMCSDTVNVIGWLLIMAGLMVLAAGVAGLGIASVGAVVASIT